MGIFRQSGIPKICQPSLSTKVMSGRMLPLNDLNGCFCAMEDLKKEKRSKNNSDFTGQKKTQIHPFFPATCSFFCKG